MADTIDFNKPFDSSGTLGKVGNSLLQKTGLGNVGNSLSRLGAAFSGKKPGPGGAKSPPDFNITFAGEADFRVRIKVPQEYLTPYTLGSNNENTNGIIFPYTPTITQDYSANYSPMAPTHSNYSLYFYKNSTPSAITVSGKFTVQSNADAYLWLSTTHLLRALTKMKFGKDVNAGTPPPVCRFFAYGGMQYKNVPVVISSYRVELPDSVDYYTTDSSAGLSGQGYIGLNQIDNMVPTISNITITLLPMYSREELLGQAQVTDYLNGSRSKGFL